MLTNVIRMYYTYDINCTKTFGFLATLASSVLAMYTFLTYRYQYFFSFFEGQFYLDKDLSFHTSLANNVVVVGAVEWGPGNGLICILLATGLTAIDILCHLLLPSPSLARSHQLQDEYEQRALEAGSVGTANCLAILQELFTMISGSKASKEEGDVKIE